MCLFTKRGCPHECILVCCATSVSLSEGTCAGYLEYVCDIVIERRFRVECFPGALTLEGPWRCSAAPRSLRKSSVPPPALTESQPLSDWTGNKGSRSLSVSHSPSFTLTLMTITRRPPRLRPGGRGAYLCLHFYNGLLASTR